MAKETMKAVVFKKPGEVALEDRPIPKIQDATDMIVKVMYTALCGRLEIPLFFFRKNVLTKCDIASFMSSG